MKLIIFLILGSLLISCGESPGPGKTIDLSIQVTQEDFENIDDIDQTESLLGTPATLSNINCVGVLVAYEGIDNATKCKTGDPMSGDIAFSRVGGFSYSLTGIFDIFAKGIEADRTLNLNILGYQAANASDCKDSRFQSINNMRPNSTGLSHGYVLKRNVIISSPFTDLIDRADLNLTASANILNNKQILSDCSGPAYNLFTLGGQIIKSKPALYFSFLQTTPDGKPDIGPTFSVTTAWASAAGTFGNAGSFTGSSKINASTLPGSLLMVNTQAFTVEAVIKSNGCATASCYIVLKHEGSIQTKVYMDMSDNLNMALTDGTNTYIYTHPTVLTSGQNYHVVFVYDGSNTQAGISIWLNGVASVATGAPTPPNMNYTGAAVLAIGNDSASGLSFNGNIDELAIYPRKLSGSEIQQHYNAYLTGN